MEQFKEFFEGLLRTDFWPARWHCGYWTDFHGWLYIFSDVVIWLSYFMIPLLIMGFVRRRKEDVPFPKIFYIFGAFILLCGSTHFIDALIFWVPIYRVSALLRFVTAIVSVSAVIGLIRILPVAFALKSPKHLEKEINERILAEQQILELNKSLELSNEALLVKSRELETFSYMASHDLKAPLRHISAITSFLKEDLRDHLNQETAGHLTLLENRTELMNNLINNLLDLSQLEKKPLLLSEVNIQELVASSAEEINADKTAEIRIGKMENCRGEAALIKQVFTNLISNSLKYTKKGRRPEIEIGSKRMSGRKVYFVKDNGIGFDKEHAKKIFEPFIRLHSLSEYDGSGIGLAIVNKIINAHGGMIWAEGETNKGAVFYFSFGPGEPN